MADTVKMEVQHDGFPIDLVDAREYMSLMLECLSTKEYKDAVEDRSSEFREGAMWGMAFCSMYAQTHAQHFGARLILPDSSPEVKYDEPLHYPCNYCGSCPVWLAAYEAPGLETSGDVIEACKARKCPLVNQPVHKEVLNG